MTVIRLQDPGLQIGQALANIGQGLGNVINPNQDIQAAVRQAIVSDPNVAQTLAGLGPEVLGELGVSEGMIGSLATLPPDASRIGRDLLLKALQGLEGGERANAEKLLLARFLDTTPEELATVEERVEAAEGVTEKDRARGATLAARGGESPESQIAQQQTILRNQQQLDLGEFKNSLIPAARQFIASQPDVGEGSARLLAGGFFEGRDFDKRLAAQMALFRARDKASQDKGFERLIKQNAIDSFQSTGAGSVEAWEQLFTDPQKAADLVSGRVKPTSDADTALLEVGRAQQNLGTKRLAQERAILHREVGTFLDQASDPDVDKSIRSFAISRVNDALAQANILGVPLFRLQFGDPPSRGAAKRFFTGQKLFFSNEQGEEIDFEIVNQMLLSGGNLDDTTQRGTTDSASSQAGLSPQAADAFRRLQAGQGTIEQLRAVRPDLALEIEGILR